MKEIKLKISLDGSGKVVSQIDDIGDGLHDLDVRDARHAKQALDQIDRTTFNHLRSQLKNTSQQLQEFGDNIKARGQDISQFGRSLTVGVTLPLLGLGVAALKTFADVEMAVASISTIKPEIDTKVLFSQLNEMSTRVPQTAVQLGEGLYNIFSSINVTHAEGLKLLENFARGATAAQTDAKTFGTAVLGVMNAYKLSVEDAAHISDVFFNTVNLGVVTGEQLATQLGEVTQAAKNAGVGFDELGALIVGVTKEGGNASVNINNLSDFLQKLPTKESSAALKQLGVDVQIDGKFRPVIDVLGDLKTKLDAMPPAAKALAMQKIFPDSQARIGALTLLSQLDAVKEALEVNKTTAGAADAAYKKIAGTASVQFQLLKNTTVAILAEIGSALLPVLQPIIIWISQNLIPAVKQAVESFKTWSPQMQRIAVIAGALVAALGPALVVIGGIVTAVGSFVAAAGALGGVGTLITVISAAFAGLAAGVGAIVTVVYAVSKAWDEGLGPIASAAVMMVGSVIAAFVPFIGIPIMVFGIAVTIYKVWESNFGGIRDFTLKVWEVIKSAFDVALNAISNLTSEIGGEIVRWWIENYPLIEKIVTNVSQTIRKILEGFASWVTTFWTNHGATIKTVLGAAWDAVKFVVMNAVKGILSVITIFLHLVNGDWGSAWNELKDLAGKALNQLWIMVVGIVKGINTALNKAVDVALEVGYNIVAGLVEGIRRKAAEAYTAAGGLAVGIANALRGGLIINSPSLVTMDIGESVGEGLELGMNNKTASVKSAAKKLADETIKELSEAVKEFQKVAGMSPDQINRTVQSDRFKQAASDLKEIIKLRAELGINQDLGLPQTPYDVSSELKDLTARKQAIEANTKALEDFEQAALESVETLRQERQAFEDFKTSIEQSGGKKLIDLQEEIKLIGVTDDIERQRITNYFDLLRLRQDMQNDGYGEGQIDEAADILKLEQARAFELQRIAQIRKETVAGQNMGLDLEKQLFQLQNGNRELSEYEKTLQKIETDLKNISPDQKEYLLNLAQQIDAQKAFNQQYKETYDFIRDSLDILTDSGTSFGEKMKSIFGGIADKFKQMILDMTAQWLTSKLFGGGGSGTFGGIFDSIKKLFGLGGSGSGASGGNASGGGGGFSLNSIRQLFGGGSGSSSNIRTAVGAHGNSSLPGAFQVSGAGGARGANGGFGLAGGLAIAGMAANILGGLIGGRAGGILSSTGTGLSIGASIGSIIPGVGTVVGAAVGAAVGFIAGLLGGDPKRRIDAKENMPKLREGFAKALAELKQLASDKNAILSDPKGAIDKAMELRGQIESGFGIKFESKKYRAVAKTQITQKLVEADALIANIRAFADTAKMANTAESRLKPEFAGGVYMDSAFMKQYSTFKRRNGMLAGAFTGRDTLPSMLAAGEMVLNPVQQARAIAAAGFDIFQHAQIPNYAGGTYVAPQISAPSFAAPMGANATVVQSGDVNVKVELHNVDVREDSYLVFETEKGKRKVISIFKEAKINKEI